jgi:hypothetical protein
LWSRGFQGEDAGGATEVDTDGRGQTQTNFFDLKNGGHRSASGKWKHGAGSQFSEGLQKHVQMREQEFDRESAVEKFFLIWRRTSIGLRGRW